MLDSDWITPQWSAPPHVRTIFSTRQGGVSTGPYHALNVGSHVGDDPTAVKANRARLQAEIGVSPLFMNQVHSTQVQRLDRMDSANGTEPLDLTSDGAITQARKTVCTIMVADCLPILLADFKGTQVGALHAGWRGLAGERGQGIVEVAAAKWGANLSEVVAWLGPCIGPQAFEVGPEVRHAFVSSNPKAMEMFTPLPIADAPPKWWANLAGLARQRLYAAGITHIYGNDGSPAWCTVGNPLRFFSHRRDRVSGRMVACIWLD